MTTPARPRVSHTVPSRPNRPRFGKIAWLIRAMRLFWWNRDTLINRMTRILHAKRSSFSANRVTRDERCRSDANEDRAVPDQRETGTAAMIPKDLLLYAVANPSRSWKSAPPLGAARPRAQLHLSSHMSHSKEPSPCNRRGGGGRLYGCV